MAWLALTWRVFDTLPSSPAQPAGAECVSLARSVSLRGEQPICGGVGGHRIGGDLAVYLQEFSAQGLAGVHNSGRWPHISRNRRWALVLWFSLALWRRRLRSWLRWRCLRGKRSGYFLRSGASINRWRQIPSGPRADACTSFIRCFQLCPWRAGTPTTTRRQVFCSGTRILSLQRGRHRQSSAHPPGVRNGALAGLRVLGLYLLTLAGVAGQCLRPARVVRRSCAPANSMWMLAAFLSSCSLLVFMSAVGGAVLARYMLPVVHW